MAELPQTLYGRLRDELRALILEGRLRPDDKLPSEAELTAQHGVSRITVRQALNDLQKEGLIVKLHGKGAFVAHPRAALHLDRLQGLGEALALEGQSVHSRRLSIKPMAAPAGVARQLGLAAGSPVVQLLTLRYLDRQPLSVNTSWLPQAAGQRLARIDTASRDFIDVFERDFGTPVAQAQLEIRACRTPAREARWLQIEAGDPALHVERILLGTDGTPLQVEGVLYRADAFSYRLTLKR